MNYTDNDGVRIRAHKVVLASASPIFRDMFQYDEEYDEYQVVHMKIKSRFLTAMVDIVYEGETKVEEREFDEFLNVLRQYRLLKFNSHGVKSKPTCRYYNRGFCKVGQDCAFNHPKEDCETHMRGTQ